MKPKISIAQQILLQAVLIAVGIFLVVNSSLTGGIIGFGMIGIAALVPIIMPMNKSN